MKLLSKKLPDGKQRVLVNDIAGVSWVASADIEEVFFTIGLSNTVKNYQLRLDADDVIRLRHDIGEFEDAMARGR